MATTTQFWNPGHALEQLGNDRDLFHDLVRIFLGEAPKQIEALRKAIASENRSDAEQAAHRLKGDLGYMSATDAAECARKLEAAAAGGDLSQAGAVLATLEANLETMFSTMRGICRDNQLFVEQK